MDKLLKSQPESLGTEEKPIVFKEQALCRNLKPMGGFGKKRIWIVFTNKIIRF
jgi:hypothetical protein